LAEELINALTQIENLKVIARTSAFSFKGKDVKVADIGRELKVDTVLEGSVRKAGNRLRITAQLVETRDSHHLWSDKYDRNMEDIFAIQDEITEVIVDKLKPMLLGEEKIELRKRQMVDLEAYNLYLKGRWFLSRQTESDLNKAIDYFNRATEKDPNYAMAYARLGRSYSLLPYFSAVRPKDTIPKAREAISKALEIEHRLPQALASLAWIKAAYDWDWEGAEQDYTQAIDLDPGHADTRVAYAFYLMWLTRFDESLREIRHALEMDPVSLSINRGLGMILCYAGRYDEAMQALQKTLEMDPSFVRTHQLIGAVYLLEGKYDEALAELEKERAGLSGWDVYVKYWICLTYAKMGNRTEAYRILNDLLEQSREIYIPPQYFADIYIGLGEIDQSFKWLDKAHVEHDQNLCYLKVNPHYESIRSDPRFIAMLKKIGLEP
jgi:tetratricopeptide (TPR) repeat protein